MLHHPTIRRIWHLLVGPRPAPPTPAPVALPPLPYTPNLLYEAPQGRPSHRCPGRGGDRPPCGGRPVGLSVAAAAIDGRHAESGSESGSDAVGGLPSQPAIENFRIGGQGGAAGQGKGAPRGPAPLPRRVRPPPVPLPLRGAAPGKPPPPDLHQDRRPAAPERVPTEEPFDCAPPPESPAGGHRKRRILLR